MNEPSDSVQTPTGGNVPGSLSATNVNLGDDIESLLLDMGPRLGGYELLILPPHRRDGHALYGDDDLDAVRIARLAGLRAALLHKPEDREYVQEYSAAYILSIAVGIGVSITANYLTKLADYVIARARQTVHEGLNDGPEEEVPVKLTIARIHHSKCATTTIDGLNIEGMARDVATTMRALLDPAHEESDKRQGRQLSPKSLGPSRNVDLKLNKKAR